MRPHKIADIARLIVQKISTKTEVILTGKLGVQLLTCFGTTLVIQVGHRQSRKHRESTLHEFIV